MILTIVICVALAITFIAIDSTWSNVLTSSRNEIVFENRLQDYGAYKLRKEHPRNLFFSLFLVLGLTGGASIASVAFGAPEVDIEAEISEKCLDCLVIPVDLPYIKDEEKIVEKETKGVEDIKPIKKPTEGLSTVEVTKDVVTSAPLAKAGGVPDGEEPDEFSGPVEPTGNPNGNTTAVVVPENKEFIIVSNPPQFPGGEIAMYKFLMGEIEFPEVAATQNVQATIYVSFVVSPSGKVISPRIERSVRGAKALEEEVIKAINQMPLWIPGSNGGTNVPVRMTLPVKFTLR